MNPAHLEAVDVQDGDGKGLLPRVHQLVDAICEPAKEQGVESLGNGIPGKGEMSTVSSTATAAVLIATGSNPHWGI